MWEIHAIFSPSCSRADRAAIWYTLQIVFSEQYLIGFRGVGKEKRTDPLIPSLDMLQKFSFSLQICRVKGSNCPRIQSKCAPRPLAMQIFHNAKGKCYIVMQPIRNPVSGSLCSAFCIAYRCRRENRRSGWRHRTGFVFCYNVEGAEVCFARVASSFGIAGKSIHPTSCRTFGVGPSSSTGYGT
jgi:hypothetical protein